MKQITISDWCNNMGISFKSYAPDIYTQNGGIERFGRQIMEKAQVIRLSTSLSHKL